MGSEKIGVLFSSGWESTACVLHTLRENFADQIVCVWVDWGADYAAMERERGRKLCEALGVRWVETACSAPHNDSSRVVAGRNARLFVAAKKKEPYAQRWLFGARNPFAVFDKYGDSNGGWARAQGLETPVLAWPKWFVRRFVQRELARRLIWSSEGIYSEGKRT